MELIDFILLGAMAGGVGLCMMLMFGGNGKRTKKLNHRIEGFRKYQGQAPKAGSANASVKRVRKEEKRWLSLVIKILPQKDKLARMLAQTGKNMTISQFLLISAAISIAVGTVITLLAGLPVILAVLIGAAAGPAVMGLSVKMMIAKRCAQFLKDFPDAIELLVRGLKAGLPIGESIANVGREFQGPIAEEFNQITETVKVGTPMNEAMWQACERIPVQEFKFFVISLSIQQETGGNLGETLGNLAQILRRRKTMKLKIKALSSEARASAYILGSLPFALFGIILLVSTDYAMVLVDDPRGQKAAAAGIGLIITAGIVMGKMVRFRI